MRVTPGSEYEPADAAEQMSAATQRLRDKAWMFSPLTAASSSTLLPGDEIEKPSSSAAQN